MYNEKLVEVTETRIVSTRSENKPQQFVNKNTRILLSISYEQVEIRKRVEVTPETVFAKATYKSRRDRHERVASITALVLAKRGTSYFLAAMDLTADYQDAVLKRRQHHPRTYTLLLQDAPEQTYYTEAPVFVGSMNICNLLVPTVVGQFDFNYAVQVGERHPQNIMTLYSTELLFDKQSPLSEDEKMELLKRDSLDTIMDKPFRRTPVVQGQLF